MRLTLLAKCGFWTRLKDHGLSPRCQAFEFAAVCSINSTRVSLQLLHTNEGLLYFFRPFPFVPLL